MNTVPNINDLLAALIIMQGKNNEKIAQYQTRITQLEQMIQSEIWPYLPSLSST
ncbi:MAG: hypothetical protein ABF649_08545 [Bacillus sp. (in: firmicutes)]